MPVSTLCQCWSLESRNGEKTIRATDHDRVLVFNNQTYLPGLALTASNMVQTLSLAPEPLDLEGALNADGILSEDLRAGSWDGASVSIFQVDWMSGAGDWLWSGYVTEIEEKGGAFSVRLSSIKSDLERTIGRVFGRRCDADFGDVRCGVEPQNTPQSFCDKRFATCRDIFENAENFRGFPHMPGNDAIISGPGEKRDGSSRGIER